LLNGAAKLFHVEKMRSQVATHESAVMAALGASMFRGRNVPLARWITNIEAVGIATIVLSAVALAAVLLSA
jgi:hypothetical protein